MRYLSRGKRQLCLALAVATLLPFLILFTAPEVRAEPVQSLRMPCRGRVIRGFEPPTGPYGQGGHQGIDIAADPGTPVVAAGAGEVSWTGQLPRGRFVSISHAGGIRTTYLDLDEVAVERGQSVGAGQRIGTVGGAGDDSSASPHLHFDVYMGGSPVDPIAALSGFDSSDYLRLCPVAETGSGQSPGGVVERDDGGFWSSLGRGALSVLKSIWVGVAAGGKWIGRTAAGTWNSGLYPALCAVGRAFRWVFTNRWVQAVAAAVAAAVIVIAALVVLVMAGIISFAVLVVGAIVVSIACLAAALIYAARHPEGFSFLRCFLTSLSAGAVAGTIVASFAAMPGVFAAGWAEMGLFGTAKAALVGGLFSSAFEAGSSYLLTGRVSLTKVLVAFGVGAVMGGISRVAVTGIKSSSRVVQVFSFVLTESRVSLIDLGSRLGLMVRECTTAIQGIVVVIKQLSITFGTRAAYMGLSGGLGTAINAAACALTGKPITFTSSLASFITGAAMGAVALSFGGEGISGMLGKLKFFREGFGRLLKGLTSRLVSKGLNKGINFSIRKVLGKLMGEEAVE